METSLERLGTYFQELEKSERVVATDEKNQTLQRGCKTIVKSLLEAIYERQPRFDSVFHGTGSYFDGAKVGKADEFDFIFEIKELSTCKAVTMVRTSDPGFVHIQVPSMDLKRQWRDCLVLPHILQTSNAESIYSLSVAQQLDRMELSDTDLSNSDCMLAPFKIQKVFTRLVNECMASLTLPDHWEHRGYKKPEYSGCRRHGPAAMLEFDYVGDTNPFKVNIDITVGIAAPLPTDVSKLNLYVFDNVAENPLMQAKLKSVFDNGPHLHVIPLYSSAIIKTKKFENKYAWRISCSLVETLMLNSFPDGGPNMCLRMLKAIRDRFFSAEAQHNKQKPTQVSTHWQDTSVQETPQQGSSKDRFPKDDLGLPMPAYEYTERIRLIRDKWKGIRETYIKLTKPDNAETMENIVEPVTDNKNDYVSSMQYHEGYIDAIAMDQQAKEKSFQDLGKTAVPITREDISEMFAEPDSGEYFGPKAYMSSIELKTYVLRLIGRHKDSEFWSMDNIVRHVNDFLRSYHTILLEKRMMRNFFFNSMVCAPIHELQLLRALEQFNCLFEELNEVMKDKPGV